jgi:hypothetical protein
LNDRRNSIVGPLWGEISNPTKNLFIEN